MNYKFFFVPALFPEAAERELNQFLSSHTVLSVDREFCTNNDCTGWSFCVVWGADNTEVDYSAANRRSQRNSVDYREVLSEEDFTVYAGLRELRKKISVESGQFVYQIFSNKQLAEMVTRRVRTERAMSEIEGIGNTRLKLHAKPFLELLAELQEPSN